MAHGVRLFESNSIKKKTWPIAQCRQKSLQRNIGHWSMATKCTVDYVRKSNTNEPDTTKKKLVNLQIYKMKTKLLCEDVFVSYNTSANDPIAEQDATTPPYTFDDCSGNTQNLITKSTKSARHICNVYKS